MYAFQKDVNFNKVSPFSSSLMALLVQFSNWALNSFVDYSSKWEHCVSLWNWAQLMVISNKLGALKEPYTLWQNRIPNLNKYNAQHLKMLSEKNVHEVLILPLFSSVPFVWIKKRGNV